MPSISTTGELYRARPSTTPPMHTEQDQETNMASSVTPIDNRPTNRFALPRVLERDACGLDSDYSSTSSSNAPSSPDSSSNQDFISSAVMLRLAKLARRQRSLPAPVTMTRHTARQSLCSMPLLLVVMGSLLIIVTSAVTIVTLIRLAKKMQ
ncbi:hypothetical protein TruAng_007261 [Truncatella angustata]|nr:hypothetical protein TruAng_007261 [Truncatella angustata]